MHLGRLLSVRSAGQAWAAGLARPALWPHSLRCAASRAGGVTTVVADRVNKVRAMGLPLLSLLPPPLPGKRQGELKQAGGERGYGRPEERGRGVGRPEEWNRRVGKPGAQGTGEAGNWGQEGADALYCTVLCYTCLCSAREPQGPAQLRPGKKGGGSGDAADEKGGERRNNCK